MSNFLLISNIGTKILRWIFFALDTAIYHLASVVYKVFHALASATLLTDSLVEAFTRRIYAILGVLMIFVIAFNLLNYIIDPDKINDKKTGAGALVKDIIIALVLITTMPMIFTKLYSLQNKILSSNVISNLILGGYTDTTSEAYLEYQNNKEGYSSPADYYIRNGANIMVANVFTAFFTPANSDYTTLECNTEEMKAEYQEYCDAYDETKRSGSIQEFNQIYTDENYNYSVVVSTAAGVLVLFFLLSFCLNLGKRVGKMAILQLLAPIPLAMEILPNKKGSRKRWFDTLMSAYLEVFIFLLVIYLVIFLISVIPDAISGLFGATSSGGSNSFVKIITMVMLIFGLLQFGKEAPKMVMDLLGIKSTGVLAAGFKRGMAMMGAAAAGVGAGVTVGTRNTVGAIKAFRGAQGAGAKWKAVGNGILRTGTGMVSGVARGAYANRTGGFKGITGRTSQAINQTMNSQGKTLAKLKDLASDVKTGHILDPIKQWATGDSMGASRTRLDTLKKVENIMKPSYDVKKDETYMGYQKHMSDILNKNGLYQFDDKAKEWMKSNPGTTVRDYLMSSQFANDFGSKGVNVANDLYELSEAMDERTNAIHISKADEIRTSVKQAKTLISSNSGIAELAQSNGIDINSINLDENSTNADILAARKTLDSFIKLISKEKKAEQNKLVEEEVRNSMKGDKKDKS